MHAPAAKEVAQCDLHHALVGAVDQLRRRDGVVVNPISATLEMLKRELGSGLVDHSQKMTVAARAMAEKKAVGHRS